MYYESNYLSHYGVLGMKWGVRRYQNKDGSLTPAGKERLYKESKKLSDEMWSKKKKRTYNEIEKDVIKNELINKMYEDENISKAIKKYKDSCREEYEISSIVEEKELSRGIKATKAEYDRLVKAVDGRAKAYEELVGSTFEYFSDTTLTEENLRKINYSMRTFLDMIDRTHVGGFKTPGFREVEKHFDDEKIKNISKATTTIKPESNISIEDAKNFFDELLLKKIEP